MIFLGLGAGTLLASFQKPFDIGLFFLLLPFAAIFIFIGYFNTKALGDVILANADGLLVETLSKEMISWDRIKYIDVTISRRMADLRLTLDGNDELLNRMLFKKYRKKKPTRRLSTCNLYLYDVNHRWLLDNIKKMHAYYTR